MIWILARFRIFTVIFIIGVFSNPISGQNISEYYEFKFNKLSTENVLPSNIIAGVVQDKNGFIWIGTSNGLARYDGIKARLFQNNQSDSTSLPNNLIKDIRINTDGIIWIATGNGIVKFDPVLEHFTDLHLSRQFSDFRGYFSRLYLDDQQRLSCWDMYSRSYLVIDTRTDSLLAIFNEKTIGEQNWIGDKRLFFVDRDDFWIVANSSELLVVTLQDGRITTRNLTNKSWSGPGATGNFNYLFKDKQGNIYCSRNGLYFLPREMKSTFDFKYIDLNNGRKPSPGNELNISSIAGDDEEMIWVATANHGLIRYNPENGRITNYTGKSINQGGIVSTNSYFLNDNAANIWVVQNNGNLQFYNHKTRDFIEFKHESNNPASIPPDIYSDAITGMIFQDLSGNYWLPSQGNGLVSFSLNKTKFPVIKSLPGNPNSLSYNGIWGLFEDNHGLLWVGIKNAGLNVIDLRTGDVIPFLTNSSPEFSRFTVCTDFLQISDNEFWISGIPLGRYLFDRQDNSLHLINEFRLDNQDTTSLSGWVVTDIFKDKCGDIWVGTFEGLNLYIKPDKNHPNGSFRRYLKNSGTGNNIANDQVWHLMEDSKNRLWIATADGLSCMNAARTRTTNYYHNPRDPLSISSSNVKCTLEDRQGRIWIATEGGGLIRFLENEKRFIDYNKSTGFPSNNIFGLFEDNSDNLWMSSTDGIIRFTPETGAISVFTAEDGLQSKQFVAGSFFQNNLTGKIYFGGDQGITHFYPDSIRLSTFIPNIVFLSLKIANEEIGVSKEYNRKVFLTRALSNTDKITLGYRENVFSIEFAALDFTASRNIRYKYLLEGANENWIETSADNKTLNYTNLAPGDYKLMVKSTNADGVWCENTKTLTIIVTPPWWQSWWFRTVFLTLAAAGIALFIRYRLNYLKNKNVELENKVKHRTSQLQEANALLEIRNREIIERNEEILANEKEIIKQAEYLHQIDQQKLQFLTNISHEFRTPLTLILGPVEKLIDQEDSLSGSGKGFLYRMIQRNSFRMLRLVNQVLDISKVEAGEMKLQVTRSDLLNHIKPVFDSFRFVAERKSIEFRLYVNAESIIGFLDSDKVEKIVYNLLSNAFKFTNPGGRIDVTVNAHFPDRTVPEADEVVIKVSDNGIGIAEEHVRHIFNRFYQVKSNVTKGTGIGLSLARDLVSLLKGSINVDSRHGTGTTFTVKLPLARETYSEFDFAEGSSTGQVDPLNMALLQKADYEDTLQNDETAIIELRSKLPIVLIVEDHDDMRRFIADELSSDYQVLEASDGTRGIEIALDRIPDLIISDLILPFVDGFTLIDTLKKDRHTSHIPIILLTSKVTEDSRMEGYVTGADSYIPKPFEMRVLKARVKNLLQVRKTLRQRFSSEVSVDPSEIVFSSADEQLLNKAIEIIEQNSKDENFNVERLAEALGIHRVQLSRKFLALTNENISDFIRITRLKKAAKLLVTRKYSISEVCYHVGFKDPAHFTRVFSKQFNITPRKYIAESQN